MNNETDILNKYIDILKAKKIIRYDADISRDLEYSKGVISSYRNGTLPPSRAFMEKFMTFYKIEQKVSESNQESFKKSTDKFNNDGYNPDAPDLNKVQNDVLMIDTNRAVRLLVELEVQRMALEQNKSKDEIRKELSVASKSELKKVLDMLSVMAEI